MRSTFPVIGISDQVQNLLGTVIADKLEWTSAERMILLRLIAVFGDDANGNKIREQTHPGFIQADNHRPGIGSFNAPDVTLLVGAGTFKEAGRFRKAPGEHCIEGVFRVSRS